MQYKYPNSLKDYTEVADGLLLTTADMNPAQKVQALIDTLEVLKKDIGIPMSIKEYGISEVRS